MHNLAKFLNDNGGVISALTLIVVLITPSIVWFKNKLKKITLGVLKPATFQWTIDGRSHDGVPEYITLFIGLEAKSEKHNNEGTIQRLFISSGNHESISPQMHPVGAVIRPIDGGTPLEVPVNFTTANPQVFYYQFNSELINLRTDDFITKINDLPVISVRVGYSWKTASMKHYKESFLDINIPTESLKVSLRTYFEQIGRVELSQLL